MRSYHSKGVDGMLCIATNDIQRASLKARGWRRLVTARIDPMIYREIKQLAAGTYVPNRTGEYIQVHIEGGNS